MQIEPRIEKTNPNKFTDISTDEEFHQFCEGNAGKVLFLYFYATWDEESLTVLETLKDYLEGYLIDCAIGFVDGTSNSIVSTVNKYAIRKVPSAVITTNEENENIKKIEKVDPDVVFQEIESQIGVFKQNLEVQRARAFSRISKLMRTHKVTLFEDFSELVGSGGEKKNGAGESSSICGILSGLGVEFYRYNIREKEKDIGRWILEMTKCEKMPLLFVNGKFVGDTSRISQLAKEGSLLGLMPRECISGNFEAKFDSILREERLVLVYSSEGQETEGSRTTETGAPGIIQELMTRLVIFRYFNLATNKDIQSFVRRSLSSVSADPQPALPLLYLDGKLLASGEEILPLVDRKPSPIPKSLFCEDQFSDIRKIISRERMVVFIKGTRQAPECGFTSQMVSILNGYDLKYYTFNVFGDEEVREKVKRFAKWKSFPMLFVDGELVGGLDVVKELIDEGEFEEIIKDLEREKGKGK